MASSRITASLTAAALVAGGLTFATSSPATAAPTQCVATNPTDTVSVFAFNDFHGRVIDDGAAVDKPGRYLAGRLFTLVEQARAAQGEDHVALISSGDAIGASTFVSMMDDDTPTLDILNAAGVEASTVGNHEFDKGWSDLSGRVVPAASGFDYLGANVYERGTTTVAAPLKSYELIEKAGITIGIVGAVTGDVPSLVSPAGISTLTFGDPVEAVNRVTGELLDGDPANGEADIVLASFHEGAASSNRTPEANAAASEAFAEIYRGIDPRVSAIFNAHTHQRYSWLDAHGRPLLQAGEYAQYIAKLDLVVDTTTKGLCSSEGTIIQAPAVPDESFPRVKEVNRIAAAAYDVAMERGRVEIGTATEAISTPDGGAEVRNEESPMTNMVAQMFHDVLGTGDPEFIGVQNPGGTRSSFDAGPVTYREAAMTLPFANSLFTTELTGAQFRTVLEQQWQRTADGVVPTRPFLQLGLSKNVSYTYDESLPEGSRITSVAINGAPLDPAKTYRIGATSFLIAGGDNFRAFTEGTGARDTGITDLAAWVEWIGDESPLSPDYSKRGVSAKLPGAVQAGAASTFAFGAPLQGGVAPQSLDMRLDQGGTVSPPLANSEIRAYVGETQVGSGTVSGGAGSVTLSLTRSATVRFHVLGSGTDIFVPVEVTQPPTPSPEPSVKPTKPGKPGRPGLPSSGADR